MSDAHRIVEGGCTSKNPFGFNGRSPRGQPTKEELERFVARSERIAAIMSWPWRVLLQALRMARPGA